jgi:predicted Zn-dependent protease with MMP-like domain
LDPGIHQPECAIYAQAIADHYACGTVSDEDHAVVHEIGHSLGQQGHVEDSIMEDGAPSRENHFAPGTIVIFRSR